MTALIVYAYCVGVFSSRKIDRATHEDVAMRVICGESHPVYTTVNAFRLVHRKALSGLFLQVLKLCARAGLKTVGHISLDGSKVQANASKHKAMSYGRMKDAEKRLQAEIEALLRRADEVDALEDARYGRDARGDELPAELQRREQRLERIRSAKAELEKEAAESRAATLRENATELREKAAQAENPKSARAARTLAGKADAAAEKLSPRDDDDDDDDGNSDATQLPLHRVKTDVAGKPHDKAQRNFTDADSRIMHRNGAFLQGYNAQAAVSEDQVIVAHGITNDSVDALHLAPMLERVRANVGGMPDVVTADSGYLSEANIGFCEKNGVDAYIAITKREASSKMPTTSAEHARFAMQVKLKTKQGAAIYARRKVMPEPVFGQIKQAMGFRRFSLRGLDKVPDEWGIVALCHNILKLFRRLLSVNAQTVAA